MDLISHFEGLLSAIQPSAGHVADAKSSQEELRETLRKDEQVREAHIETYLSGSYARHTAILDIKDVDVICLLEVDPDQTEPIVLQRWLESRLLEYYPKVVLQGRSIGISTSDGFDLDVVPGAPIGSESQPIWIPDRQAGSWVDSHPKGQIEFAQKRNKDTAGYYIQVVKLLKYWRNRLPAPAVETKSYVVEALVAHTLGSAPPQSHGHAVVIVLEGILDRFGGNLSAGVVPEIPDPGYPSKSVSKRWKPSEFISFISQVRTSASYARQAWEEDDENTSKALWKRLFGAKFTPSE